MATIPDWVIQKLNEGIGNYYGDPLNTKPTTFLAMLETADGCIRFMDTHFDDPQIKMALMKPVRMGEAEEGNAVTMKSRTYQLWDRSGSRGIILHYREVI